MPFDKVDRSVTTAANWFDITPSDTVEQPAFKAVHVGGTAGTIVAVSQTGVTCTFQGAVGQDVKIANAKFINAASTATGLVGMNS